MAAKAQNSGDVPILIHSEQAFNSVSTKSSESGKFIHQTTQPNEICGLNILCGPMFSGKTTELIDRLHIYTHLGMRVAYINHALDTRGKAFSTHNEQMKLDLQFKNSFSTDDLSKVNIGEFDVIGIDEAQFFESLEIVKEWSKVKLIIMAGLMGDVKRNKFGKMADLIPHADKLEFFHAKCKMCAEKRILKDAPFTKKITKPSLETPKLTRDASSSPVIDVGAADKYIAVCRMCFENNT